MASVIVFEALEDSDFEALLEKQKAREDSGSWIRCGHCAHPITTADKRIERVLWNDPATVVMRHADAGYEDAVACAQEHGLRLPGILGN